MSKGSRRRPEARPGVYAEAYERIFGAKYPHTNGADYRREVVVDLSGEYAEYLTQQRASKDSEADA